MGEDEQRGKEVEPLHKRRETMADGRRYIIYYTFGDDATGEKSPESGTHSEEAGDV